MPTIQSGSSGGQVGGYQTASNLASPGLPNTAVQGSGSPPTGGSKSAQPTATEVYQAGYKPLFFSPPGGAIWYRQPGCECKDCQKWDSLTPGQQQAWLAWAEWWKENCSWTAKQKKAQATPPPSQSPVPVAAPRKISRPLDLRRGAEIRLTEEEAQLAMSAASGGGIDIRPRSKSLEQKWVQTPAYPYSLKEYSLNKEAFVKAIKELEKYAYQESQQLEPEETADSKDTPF